MMSSATQRRLGPPVGTVASGTDQGRKGVEQRQTLLAVVAIRLGQNQSQRCSVAVHDKMAFAAQLGAVDRVWAGDPTRIYRPRTEQVERSTPTGVVVSGS